MSMLETSRPVAPDDAARALAERVKELRAMHRIAELLRHEDRPLADLVAAIAAELAAAMQWPELAAASVAIDGARGTSAGWRETTPALEHRFDNRDGASCEVRVVYLAEPAASGGAPFIDEERDLLRWTAETLGQEAERRASRSRLADDEALLEMASRLARFGAWRVDLKSGKVRWTGQARAIHGLGADEEPTLEALLSRYAPEDRARMATLPEAFDEELRIREDGERTRWVRALGEAVRDASGAVVGVQGAVLDVTERKEAELALRRSEARLHILAHAADVAFFDWNLAPGSVDDVGGMIEPEDRARIVARARALAETEDGAWVEELRARTPTGVRHLLARGQVERDERGRPARVIGGVADITELRRATETMREQAALLDKARDAIMVRDLEHRITFWNRSCERLYGWSAAEAVGRVAHELLGVDPAVSRRASDGVLADGEWWGEVDKVGKDGKVHAIEARWSLVRDDAGRPRAVFSIDTDVTARRRLEQQLMRAQRLESLGTLAGGIAHDLNNVLSPILMAAHLLEDSERDPERRRDLAAIRANTERGAELIKQLLGFARGQGGARHPLDLASVAAEVEHLVRDTFPRAVKVRFEIAEARWPVVADPTQVQQLLLNLCVNARDAMPRGGSLVVAIEPVVVDEVQAGMHPGAKPGRCMRVRVEDTGSGMTPDVIERVFDPFFTTKASGHGTGLGLSMVHTIVRSHGGWINVYSEPGRGARFSVYLPAEGGAPEEGGAADVALEAAPSGDGELVLIVDDEEAIRFVTQRTLERFGYRVLVASNGAEAVAVFARHRDEIALVLTDMAMPIMDGPATIVALRSMRPRVRIIGSSGLGSNELVAKSIEAGARWFVDKPYTADALLRAVRRALRDQAE